MPDPQSAWRGAQTIGSMYDQLPPSVGQSPAGEAMDTRMQSIRERLLAWLQAQTESDPEQPVMARARTGALYPSSIGTPQGAALGFARGVGEAGLSQVPGSTGDVLLSRIPIGGGVRRAIRRSRLGPSAYSAEELRTLRDLRDRFEMRAPTTDTFGDASQATWPRNQSMPRTRDVVMPTPPPSPPPQMASPLTSHFPSREASDVAWKKYARRAQEPTVHDLYELLSELLPTKEP